MGISNRKREALGRLAQVISCADRALCRDVTAEDDDDVTGTPAPVVSTHQEGVDTRRNALAHGPRESLFLGVIQPSLRSHQI